MNEVMEKIALNAFYDELQNLTGDDFEKIAGAKIKKMEDFLRRYFKVNPGDIVKIKGGEVVGGTLKGSMFERAKKLIRSGKIDIPPSVPHYNIKPNIGFGGY